MSVGLLLGQRYRLIEELGRGGMGSVWRADDLELDTSAAVKLIEPELVQSSEALARFKREARAAAAIRSTHVVQILGYGVDNGIPYIAMELLKGESLAKRLEQAGKLSPEFTLAILTHVGHALALAHESGIVHRDLKPDNVFIVREMNQFIAKVLDFGIARQRGGLGDTGDLKTKTGALLGTPYYMSPEQATGKNVDHLTDIWSFGVIAMECLTGGRPFESDSIGGLFSAICMEPLPVPSLLSPVPMGFDAWFARTVARDKSVRFQSIMEAIDHLELVCGRPSRRSSELSVSAERGGTVLSSGVSLPAQAASSAGSAMSVGMQTTSAPSSRSVAGLPRQRRSAAPIFAASIVAVIVVGLYAGWRLMRKPDTANTPAPVAASSLGTKIPAQSALPQPTRTVSSSSPTTIAPSAAAQPEPVASTTATRATKPSAPKSGGPAIQPKPGAVEQHPSLPASANAAELKPVQAVPTNDRLGI